MLGKRTIAFLCVMLIVYCSQGQKQIERYLVDAKLATEQQLKKYHEKEKKDDDYVRMMIKLMKDRRMEKEYKEELKKKAQNKDTLSILADILEEGVEKRYADDTVTNQLKQNFIDFTHQLRNTKLISEENTVNLLNRLKDGWMYDSSQIVRNAIGFKNKAAVTTPTKLKGLSTLFKDLGLISNEKYQKLVSEPFPDSTSPVQHIVAACEKAFIFANPGFIYFYNHVWNGFIMLTEPQAEGLYHNENVEISYEERLPTLTTADIQRAVSIYKKAGIFDRVSQGTVDSVINDAKENPLFRYNELISRFPAISLLIKEDKTITENEALALVKRVAEVSNYAFNPQNARFEKEANGTTWFLMDINGKTYKEMFISGWASIWSVVHNAVFSDLKRTGQFEVARLNQHEEVIIYVTPAQMKMLEKEKVINDY